MPESETKLEELVGEGKKYKTLEDLAKSRVEADAFIDQLKSETATLREELARLTTKTNADDTLEKLMEALKNKNNDPGSKTPEPVQPKDSGNQPGTLTSEDIVKIMEAREQAQREVSNLNQSLAALKKVYGEKSDEVLNQKAVDLGVGRDEIEAIAKKSPSAFANLVGLNRSDSTTRPMARDGVHLPPNQTPKDGVRNKAYYDNVRKEMGISKFIMDKSLQVQLHRDMMRLGDEWDS